MKGRRSTRPDRGSGLTQRPPSGAARRRCMQGTNIVLDWTAMCMYMSLPSLGQPWRWATLRPG